MKIRMAQVKVTTTMNDPLLAQGGLDRGLIAWESWLAATQGQIGASSDKSHSSDERSNATSIGTFEQFFRRYEPQVSGYLWRMLGDEQSAYDLSQDAFLRAWQHFSEVAHHPRPVSWLFRVATNLAINHLRRRAAPIGAATPIEDHDPAASDPTGHFVERDLVRQTLLTLAPKARALLVLREVYGLSCAEAGQTLGMSPDAAKMALSRAREQFRQHYLRKDAVR